MLTALLLQACSNVNEREFYTLSSGSRHATGSFGEPSDTGDTSTDTVDTSDTGGSTGRDAPVISAVDCSSPEEGGTITMAIHYSDPQPDVVGGRIYYNVNLQGEVVDANQSRNVVASEDMTNASLQAGDDGSAITAVHQVSVSGDFIVDYIVILDDAGHSSSEEACQVTVP